MLENKIVKHIVVTGYSGGGGKTHLLKKILSLVGHTHQFSVSHTTRTPRGKEEDGKDYYFTDEKAFKEMLSNDQFLEWNNPREGIWYGTSIDEYNRIKALGKAIAFDIDYEGAKQLSYNVETKGTICVVAPLPNVKTRHDWMVQRGDMSEEKISERLAYSEKHERPFFEDHKASHLIHWKLQPYDASLPASDDILANIIANHICHGTPLALPKSLAVK